jgi:hypothetical protein
MAYPVSGSPVTAFVDAIRTLLLADATLTGLLSSPTAIYGHLSEAERTAYPYVVLGRRSRTNDAGAMSVAGSMMSLQVDVWSDHKGPFEAQSICSRIARLLERASLAVTGFDYVTGSLTCEMEEVFDEPDEDSPDRRVYHGVQRWAAELHEIAA